MADYVQHRDPEIVTTNGYHQIRVVSEYGLVALYYDGKFKGLTAFPYRPGSRIGFRSLPRSGRLSIRDFQLRKLPPAESRTVLQLPPENFLQGVIHQDQGVAGPPSQTDRLTVDVNTGAASLQYGFTAGSVFESRFVRILIGAAACNTVLLEVDGDSSENNFFIIVHDASGEQHLILKTSLAWQGWQEVGVPLGTFLESPKDLERRALHWGGDHNQKIDFPLQAMDLGIAKRGGRVQDRGKLRLRKVRFLE